MLLTSRYVDHLNTIIETLMISLFWWAVYQMAVGLWWSKHCLDGSDETDELCAIYKFGTNMTMGTK